MLAQFKDELISYQQSAQQTALKSNMGSIKLSLFDRAKQQAMTVSAGRMSMLIAQSENHIDQRALSDELNILKGEIECA